MQQKPISRRSWLILMLSLMGFVGVFFVWLMWWMAPSLENLRQSGDVFYECVEVVSGDELLLRDIRNREGKPISVKVEGILAPPLHAGNKAEAFAEASGIPVERIAGLGEVSRNCLISWLYKQSSIQLGYDRENPVYDSQGRLLARVSLSLVDVGAMQLNEGQAIPSKEPFENAGLYAKLANKARNQNIGIWRP